MLYSAVQPFFRLQFLLRLLALICSKQAKAGENGNPDPAVYWSVSTGGPIYSSPVIDQQFLVFGSTDSSLYVVDHRSGKVAWTYKTGGAIRCTPYVRNGIAYFLSDDGKVYAVSIRSHARQWICQTEGEARYPLYGYADYFHSSPVADDSTLYFGSGDGHVYALRLSDGSLRWKFKTDAVVHGTGVISEGTLYIGSFDGNVYALATADGGLRWKFKTVGQTYFPRGEVQGTVACFGDRLIVGARDYNLYCLDAEGGTGLWNRQFRKGWAMGVPVIRDSIVYVGTSDDRLLLALDPFSGQAQWEAPVNFNVFGGAAFGDSSLYIGNLRGELLALEVETGKMRWKFTTPGGEEQWRKYLTASGEYRPDIQSIIQKGEDFVTMYHSMGAIFTTPTVSEGRIFFTSTDGSLYCLQP